MQGKSALAQQRTLHGLSRLVEGFDARRRMLADVALTLTAPSGWVKIQGHASVSFCPDQAKIPCVKLHLTGFRVDTDIKEGKRVVSKTKKFADLKSTLAYLESELNELSLKKDTHGSV